jgi:hypothetical protein
MIDNDYLTFLEARIAEDERDAHPRTVVVSGGWPAPEVPNCIGRKGTGCADQWKVQPEDGPGWWQRADIQALISAHELTHASATERRTLAECEAHLAQALAEITANGDQP